MTAARTRWWRTAQQWARLVDLQHLASLLAAVEC